MTLPYAILCMSITLITMIDWLYFAATTVRPIERLLAAEGIEPCPWDGAGFRIPTYALLLTFHHNHRIVHQNPMIDGPAVLSMARPRDITSAKVFCVISASFLVTMFWASYVIGG